MWNSEYTVSLNGIQSVVLTIFEQSGPGPNQLEDFFNFLGHTRPVSLAAFTLCHNFHGLFCGQLVMGTRTTTQQLVPPQAGIYCFHAGSLLCRTTPSAQLFRQRVHHHRYSIHQLCSILKNVRFDLIYRHVGNVESPIMHVLNLSGYLNSH